MTPPVVYVVGSINADLVLSVERLPDPGETVLAESARRGAGGKGANQAVAAAAAGARVCLIGAVGDDDAAGEVLDQVTAAGVDCSRVVARPASTGQAVVIVDNAGENSIVVVSGANGSLTAAHVDDALAEVTPADVVLAQGEVPPAAIAQAARCARSVGATFVLNLAPVIDLDLDRIRPAVLVVNEHEARLIADRLGLPSAAETVAGQLAGRAAEAVVVTRGARGALVADGSGVSELAAPTVERVVDTTGAGDAFVGALAAALAAGDDLLVAVRHGIAAGSVAVQHPGAQGGA